MAHSPFAKEGGGKTAVLMIHGILGSPDHFRELLPCVPADWSVRNVLLDGHGGSTADFARTSMKKWEAQIAGQVEELAARHERVVVVGYSMGSLLAMGAATAQPGKIAGLFLLNVPLWAAPKPRSISLGLRVVFDRPSEDPAFHAAKAGCSIQLTRYIWKYVRWIPRYLELFGKMRRVRKAMEGLALPCCAFQSAYDELVLKRSDILLQRHPTIETAVLRDSGHFYYAPADLTQIKQRFEKFCTDII